MNQDNHKELSREDIQQTLRESNFPELAESSLVEVMYQKLTRGTTEPIKGTEFSDPRSQELKSVLDNMLLAALEDYIALREREARIAEWQRIYDHFENLDPKSKMPDVNNPRRSVLIELNELKKGEE